MTPDDIAQMRIVCKQNPAAILTLPGWELLELLDKLEDVVRQRDHAREHAERKHGCSGACGGRGGE